MSSEPIRVAESFQIGEHCQLDLRAYELRRSGRVLKLERIPMELLLLLVQRRGELVSREEIVKHIWGSGVYLDTDNSINAAIRKVRHALRDNAENPRYIQTVVGVGYRFIAPVTEPHMPTVEDIAPAVEHSVSDIPVQAPVPGAPRHKSRSWILPAACLLAAVASVVLLLGWARHGGNGKAVQARRAVAVLGFRNLSQDHTQDWVSTALTEMVSTELGSGQQMRMIPAENVANMKLDLALPVADSYGPETLLRIRKDLGSDVLVLGSYLASGAEPNGTLRIDVKIEDASGGDLIGVVSETGTMSDMAGLVSRAGVRLRRTLGVAAPAPSEANELKASLPINSDALRLYSEGLTKLRTLDALEARDLLQQSIAADGSFALSHSALAEVLHSLGYDSQAQAEAKRAFELSKNLPRQDQLLIEGRYRELTHDWPAAVQLYQSLSEFFPDEIEYGLRLASAQMHSGSSKDALVTITRLRQLPDSEGRDVRIDLLEAHAAEHLSDYARSEQVAAFAALKAQVQGSRLARADALQQEGYAFIQLGEGQKALALFTESRDLSAAAGDIRGAASALHSIAALEQTLGDFDRSRDSYEQALKTFRRIGAMWDVASCSHNLGTLFLDEGKPGLARRPLEEALRIQRELKDDRGVAYDLDDVSNVLVALGELSTALPMKLEALSGFERMGDRKGEAVALINLGGLYFAQGALSSAQENFDKSLSLLKEVGYKQSIGDALSDISEVLMAEDRLDEARATTARAIALRRQLHDEVDVADSQLQMAQIELRQGSPKQAEDLARDSQAVFEKQHVIDRDADALAILSRSLLREGRKAEARAAADRAVAVSGRGEDMRAHFESALALAAVKGNSGQALDAIQELRSLSAEAHDHGYVGYEFQIELLADQTELRSGQMAAGRKHLAQLEKEARARGFSLVARQAAMRN